VRWISLQSLQSEPWVLTGATLRAEITRTQAGVEPGNEADDVEDRPRDMFAERARVGRHVGAFEQDRANLGVSTHEGFLSLSKTYALKYWWCSPPRTGIASVRPTVWTARGTGASFCNDRCVRASL
jgi:hypothetical protein